MADAPRTPEIDPRDLTSFSEAGRFEEVFRQHGIPIARGSDLESVSLDLMLMEGRRLGEGRPEPMTDIRLMLERAAGWIVLSRNFKVGDEWKSSASFGRDELLTVAKVADPANTWIHNQNQEAAGNESDFGGGGAYLCPHF